MKSRLRRALPRTSASAVCPESSDHVNAARRFAMSRSSRRMWSPDSWSLDAGTSDAGNAHEPLGMPLVNAVQLPRGSQLLGGELADGLEHEVAGLVVSGRGWPHEALGDDRQEVSEVGLAYRFDRRERRPADEHRQAAEQTALVVLEQVVAPSDRGPERALTLVGVTGTAPGCRAGW